MVLAQNTFVLAPQTAHGALGTVAIQAQKTNIH